MKQVSASSSLEEEEATVQQASVSSAAIRNSVVASASASSIFDLSLFLCNVLKIPSNIVQQLQQLGIHTLDNFCTLSYEQGRNDLQSALHGIIPWIEMKKLQYLGELVVIMEENKQMNIRQQEQLLSNIQTLNHFYKTHQGYRKEKETQEEQQNQHQQQHSIKREEKEEEEEDDRNRDEGQQQNQQHDRMEVQERGMDTQEIAAEYSPSPPPPASVIGQTVSITPLIEQQQRPDDAEYLTTKRHCHSHRDTAQVSNHNQFTTAPSAVAAAVPTGDAASCNSFSSFSCLSETMHNIHNNTVPETKQTPNCRTLSFARKAKEGHDNTSQKQRYKLKRQCKVPIFASRPISDGKKAMKRKYNNKKLSRKKPPSSLKTSSNQVTSKAKQHIDTKNTVAKKKSFVDEKYKDDPYICKFVSIPWELIDNSESHYCGIVSNRKFSHYSVQFFVDGNEHWYTKSKIEQGINAWKQLHSSEYATKKCIWDECRNYMKTVIQEDLLAKYGPKTSRDGIENFKGPNGSYIIDTQHNRVVYIAVADDIVDMISTKFNVPIDRILYDNQGEPTLEKLTATSRLRAKTRIVLPFSACRLPNTQLDLQRFR